MNRLPLPGRKQPVWLGWFIAYTLLLSGLLWLGRFVAANQPFELVYAGRLALLAAGLALVVNGLGWLGARWLWLCATAGIAAGAILMIWTGSRDMTGWEDLVSFIQFLMCSAAGIALGILAELVQWGVRSRTDKRNG